jgi:hypothetical protein
VPWSLGAVLNPFARVFDVLAKAMGGVAASPDTAGLGGRRRLRISSRSLFRVKHGAENDDE